MASLTRLSKFAGERRRQFCVHNRFTASHAWWVCSNPWFCLALNRAQLLYTIVSGSYWKMLTTYLISWIPLGLEICVAWSPRRTTAHPSRYGNAWVSTPGSLVTWGATFRQMNLLCCGQFSIRISNLLDLIISDISGVRCVVHNEIKDHSCVTAFIPV